MPEQAALPNRAARRALAQIQAPGPEHEQRREYNALVSKAMSVSLRHKCDCEAAQALRNLVAFILESAAEKEAADAPGDDPAP